MIELLRYSYYNLHRVLTVVFSFAAKVTIKFAYELLNRLKLIIVVKLTQVFNQWWTNMEYFFKNTIKTVKWNCNVKVRQYVNNTARHGKGNINFQWRVAVFRRTADCQPLYQSIQIGVKISARRRFLPDSRQCLPVAWRSCKSSPFLFMHGGHILLWAWLRFRGNSSASLH